MSVARLCCRSSRGSARAACTSAAMSAITVTVLPAPSASASKPPRSWPLMPALTWSCHATPGSAASA